MSQTTGPTSSYRYLTAEMVQLRAELAASVKTATELAAALQERANELARVEALVDALNTQRGVDAVAAMRAVEEAREEQREACWLSLSKWNTPTLDAADARVAVRATPLDSTPLADEIERLLDAALKEELAEVQSIARESMARFDELHAMLRETKAERDALKAELAAAREDAEAERQARQRYEREAAKFKNTAEMHESLRAETLKGNLSLQAQVERLTAALKCNASDYGTHRCVRCDSEVEP